MKYKSKREEITNFINDVFLPTLIRTQDMEYSKTISEIAMKTSSSKYMVEEALNIFIDNGKVIKTTILTIPEDKIIDYLKSQKEEEEIKEESEQEIKQIAEAETLPYFNKKEEELK